MPSAARARADAGFSCGPPTQMVTGAAGSDPLVVCRMSVTPQVRSTSSTRVTVAGSVCAVVTTPTTGVSANAVENGRSDCGVGEITGTGSAAAPAAAAPAAAAGAVTAAAAAQAIATVIAAASG